MQASTAANFVLLIEGDAAWRFAVLYAFSAILFALMLAAFLTMNARFEQLMSVLNAEHDEPPRRSRNAASVLTTESVPAEFNS